MTLDAARQEMARYASMEPGLVATAGTATTATTRPPTATTTATTEPAAPYHANCDAVRAAGKAPLHRGDPDYRSGLHRAGDGAASE